MVLKYPMKKSMSMYKIKQKMDELKDLSSKEML